VDEKRTRISGGRVLFKEPSKRRDVFEETPVFEIKERDFVSKRFKTGPESLSLLE
jgi:hypothetical protein